LKKIASLEAGKVDDEKLKTAMLESNKKEKRLFRESARLS